MSTLSLATDWEKPVLGGNRTHARQSNRRGGGYCEGEGRFPSRGRLEFGGVVVVFLLCILFLFSF